MNHIPLIKCPELQIGLVCLLTRAFYSVYNRTRDVFGRIILFLLGKLEQENAHDMSCAPMHPAGSINIFT